MSEAATLEVRGLAHAFDGHPVFEDLGFDVKAAEFAAVLGPSGCGKSTLLRCVAGLVAPDRGSIVLGDEVLCESGRELVPPERRRVGLVFQDYALFPTLSVRDNVGFSLRRASRSERDSRVDELLELCGLRGLDARLPAQLSGGQQQRVALARAMAPKPRLLLLDEPFANVDASLRESLAEQLQLLVRRERTSALLVTHDRGDALRLADRIAVISPAADGRAPARLAQHDRPEIAYRRPLSADVALQLGCASIVEARAEGTHAATPLGRAQLLEPRTGPVRLVVRPEDVRFLAANREPRAEIAARLYHGSGYRLCCRTAAGEILSDAGADDGAAVGAGGTIEFVRPCWALPF